MGMMAIVVPADVAAAGTGPGAGAVTDAARLHPMSATTVIIAEMRRLFMECERRDSGSNVEARQ